MRMDERTCALLLLAVSILVGVFSPQLALLLEPFSLPALFVVVVFSLVPFAQLGPRELIAVTPDVVRVLVWQLLVLPMLVVAIGTLCRFPSPIVSLLVVTACSGALFASPALAALLDLDQRQSLQCMVLSTLLMPVSLYAFLWISSYESVKISVDVEVYVVRILIYLVLPGVLFCVYRAIDRRLSDQARQHSRGFSRWAAVVALAIFGIGRMNGVAEQLTSNPAHVFFFLGLTTVMCVGMLVLTTIVMHRYGMGEALTAAILSGFRNVGLGYALIGEMIGPDLSIYVGIGLLPVFTAPLIIKLMADRRIWMAERSATAS